MTCTYPCRYHGNRVVSLNKLLYHLSQAWEEGEVARDHLAQTILLMDQSEFMVCHMSHVACSMVCYVLQAVECTSVSISIDMRNGYMLHVSCCMRLQMLDALYVNLYDIWMYSGKKDWTEGYVRRVSLITCC